MNCTTGYISGSRLTAELTPIKTDLAQATSVNLAQAQQITALQTAVTAGAANTVPAAGVLAGTLPSTVALNSTANFGTGAAATDTALGVVSLAVAANYPSASNVEAVTPAYLTEMNAAIKAGNFGKHLFVTAPTSAPSLADPATVKTNLNGEVFMYNGTRWVYVGGGEVLLTGNFPVIMDPKLTFLAVDNPASAVGAVTTITNPSSTRTAELRIYGWNQGQASSALIGSFSTFVFIDGVFNHNLAQSSGVINGIFRGTAGNEATIYMAPGRSLTVGFAARWSGSGTLTLDATSVHVFTYQLKFLG